MRRRELTLAGGGVALGVAAMAGALLQRRNEARDRANHPPPGRFADVGGYRLHHLDAGNGAPTVLLDSGLGGNLLSWELVAPEIATFARVVRYDRPGLGWSDPSPAGVARLPSVVAGEARALLRAIGAPPPYVLVGWSLGGPHMRAFAARWPAEVAGLVLVDASHEEQLERLPASMRRLSRLVDGLLQGGAALADVGSPLVLAPLYQKLVLAQVQSDNHIPAEVWSASSARDRSRQALRATAAESAGVAASLAELRELRATTTFPPVPVVVVTRDLSGPVKGPEAEMLPAWQELQADQAALSPRGRQVYAEGSGHLIPIDRPDAVIAAVRDVVEQVRQTASA